MIISDLEHLAIVSEETEIEGGFLASLLDAADIALIGAGVPVAANGLISNKQTAGKFVKNLLIEKPESVAGLFAKNQVKSFSVAIGFPS
jgi:hypothetical protein